MIADRLIPRSLLDELSGRRRADRRRQGPLWKVPGPGEDQRAARRPGPGREVRGPAEGRRPVRLRPRRRGDDRLRRGRGPRDGRAGDHQRGRGARRGGRAGSPIGASARTSTSSRCTSRPDIPASTVDWKLLARSEGTLILLMAVERIAEIADTLLREGRSPETPVMVRYRTVLFPPNGRCAPPCTTWLSASPPRACGHRRSSSSATSSRSVRRSKWCERSEPDEGCQPDTAVRTRRRGRHARGRTRVARRADPEFPGDQGRPAPDEEPAGDREEVTVEHESPRSRGRRPSTRSSTRSSTSPSRCPAR